MIVNSSFSKSNPKLLKMKDFIKTLLKVILKYFLQLIESHQSVKLMVLLRRMWLDGHGLQVLNSQICYSLCWETHWFNVTIILCVMYEKKYYYILFFEVLIKVFKLRTLFLYHLRFSIVCVFSIHLHRLLGLVHIV